jgi:hypothetical protein
MAENVLMVALLVFLGWLWRNHNRQTGQVTLPGWLWKVVGAFLLLMLIRHASEAYSFVSGESDNWWPLVKKNAASLLAGFRHLIGRMSQG